MKDTKFRILLDIHEVRSQATIPVKVGDVSCKIYITLVEGGKPYKIHENSFGVFTGQKGDDNYLFNNCVIENGVIRYDFTPQTVAAAGILECEVRIYDEDGGVLTTPSFTIVVDERAVKDSDLASSNEFSFLDEIIVNEGQRIKNEEKRIAAFNNFGIDLEDDGEVINIVKTDIDGSQEKSTFLKYADVIPSVTATASGSAISIESANAPLQNLKLYGKTTQDGTPTPENPIELKSVGDSGSFEVGVYGKNLFPQSNVSGVESKDVVVNIPKGTYTFSAEHTSSDTDANFGLLMFVHTDGSFSYATCYRNRRCSCVITLKTDVKHITFFASDGYIKSAGDTFSYSNIQIELGTTATDYEPYKAKQTLTMPYISRGVGEVADEIDFARGVRTPRIKHRVFNGTENWYAQDTIGYFYSDTFWDYTNHFENWNINKFKSNVGSIVPYSTIDSGGYGLTYAGNYRIKFENMNATNNTVDEFKAYLQANPITIIGVMDTPQEIPLTETELNAYRQLVTNSGTTTILSEANMEVDYYVNKLNAQAIGNIHSQMNKDYFKLQQAIIETGGN